MQMQIGVFGLRQRRLRRVAQQWAVMCGPRVLRQAGGCLRLAAGPMERGYVRAWASLAVQEVATSDLGSGLSDSQRQELSELAVQKAVEAALAARQPSHYRTSRKAA